MKCCQTRLTRPLTPVDWTEEDELAEDRRAAGTTDGRESSRPH